MTRRTTLSLTLLACCATPFAAFAQQAYLQSSGIVGQNNTLSINRLPVADASGNFTYDDVTVNFLVAADGTLSQQGKAKIKKSADPQSDGFIAGRYFVKYASDATQFGTVTSGVGSGGSTVWSLVMDGPPNGAFPDQAVWQTGTPAPDVAARLAAAKVIMDPDYSYGRTVIGNHINYNNFEDDNGLLAAQQISNNLTLMSYTNHFNGDQANVQASVIYTLCADTACSNASK